MLLVVHGSLTCIGHGRIEVHAGMGVLPEESEEEYSVETSAGAIVMVVEAPRRSPRPGYVHATADRRANAGPGNRRSCRASSCACRGVG